LVKNDSGEREFAGKNVLIYTHQKCPLHAQEYDDLIHEFMMATKQAYGEKVLVQVMHLNVDLLSKNSGKE
jgi:hypothetical protein